jgi:hypothetical protein
VLDKIEIISLKKSVLYLRKIMISFVVENFNNSKPAHKTPRYKLKIKLLKTNLISNMLKFTAYRIINLPRLDFFYDSFKFFNYLNRSSIVFNLTLSYYYKNLNLLIKRKDLKSRAVLVNFRASLRLLGLPVSFRTTNFIFFHNIYFSLSYYIPFYKFYSSQQHYFQTQKLLKTYSNLNFYYSKVYEH